MRNKLQWKGGLCRDSEVLKPLNNGCPKAEGVRFDEEINSNETPVTHIPFGQLIQLQERHD